MSIEARPPSPGVGGPARPRCVRRREKGRTSLWFSLDALWCARSARQTIACFEGSDLQPRDQVAHRTLVPAPASRREHAALVQLVSDTSEACDAIRAERLDDGPKVLGVLAGLLLDHSKARRVALARPLQGSGTVRVPDIMMRWLIEAGNSSMRSRGARGVEAVQVRPRAQSRAHASGGSISVDPPVAQNYFALRRPLVRISGLPGVRAEVAGGSLGSSAGGVPGC